VIIDDDHKFIFVHIPKTGGTSVRKFVDKFNTQSGSGLGVGLIEHPDIGKLDGNHIPLMTLKMYFPEQFEKFYDYESFTIIRDPSKRFLSSLYQHMRMYGADRVKGMRRSEMLASIEKLIKYLQENLDECPLGYRYIHFQRQVTYVYCEGEQIVRRLYLIDELPQLMKAIGKHLGEEKVAIAGAVAHENPSQVYKAVWMKNLHKGPGKYVDKLALTLLKTPLRPLVEDLRGLLHTPLHERIGELIEVGPIQQFLREHYAEDYALYKRLEGEKVP
jgi:hypothetical protein